MKYNFKGIEYKSNGEYEIAKYLDYKRIKFTYEKQIKIIDEHNMERLWYPDFYLDEYDIIVEFFGMKDNKNYENGTRVKKKAYYKNGYNVIPIYHETLEGKWQQYLMIRIKKLKNNFNDIDIKFDKTKQIPEIFKIRIVSIISILICLFFLPISFIIIIAILLYWGNYENKIKNNQIKSL